jgi:arylsulfatase
MKKNKNVLWIMTDQHQAACLGCMGNSIIQTPNLDRLAAGGVLFENAFCQSPVCMASRASVFTGRYPEATRVRGMGVLPPGETTFPEQLRRHGYRTGAFGKVHLTPEVYTNQILKSEVPVLDWKRFAADAHITPVADDPFKENYGFETHVGCDDKCRGNYYEWLKNEAPELLEKEIKHFPDAPGDLYVSPMPSEYHHTTYIANQAESYIRSNKDSDTPWMTFCSFIAPHHPFDAPEDQIARYNDGDIPLPQTENIGVDIQNPPDALIPAIDEMKKYPENIQRMIIKHYYASISLIDDCVGSLIKALEETGQKNDTLILFVSDHGEHLGGHNLLRKPSFHYDEVIKVPLIMNSPEINPGRRERGLVELTDVYPTLLGLLDLPITPGVQGIDWSEALLANTEIGREDIYSDMYEMDPQTHGRASGPYCACTTIRTEKYKLNIYPTGRLDSSQLFDLENDPAESRNCFHDPKYKIIKDEMLWRLITRVHGNTDPLPLRLTQF